MSDTNESTTGGALGTTQGSCLPLTCKIVGFFVLISTVNCFLDIDEAGLNATLIVIGIPVDKPPKIPPALLVFVTIFPFFMI